MLKVLLALREQTLPPTANFSNPVAPLAKPDCPFGVLAKPRPWERRQEGRPSKIQPPSEGLETSEVSPRQIPRRAAVTAFGFGGINAHVLLEEWIPSRADRADSESQSLLSAGAMIHGSSARSTVPIAIVGIGAHFGPWPDRQAFQDRIFRARSVSDGGRPREIDAPCSPCHWWGAENSAWFRDHVASRVAWLRVTRPSIGSCGLPVMTCYGAAR